MKIEIIYWTKSSAGLQPFPEKFFPENKESGLVEDLFEANKIAQIVPNLINRQHTKVDCILYVGKTFNPSKRRGQHQGEKGHMKQMHVFARRKIELHDCIEHDVQCDLGMLNDFPHAYSQSIDRGNTFSLEGRYENRHEYIYYYLLTSQKVDLSKHLNTQNYQLLCNSEKHKK